MPESPANRRETIRAKRRSDRQQTILVIVIITVMLGAVIFFALREGANENIEMARLGEPISDFELEELGGKRVKLKDYRGRPVMINFWATWCPPCRAEMPVLQQYRDAHAAQGLELLAINAGESAREAGFFASQNNFTFPILLDLDMAVTNGLRITGFPTTLLVDRAGVVRKIHIGLLTPDILESDFTPLLGD